MSGKVDEFQKEKECLLCVDSDGCAMDTMDIKHIRCFGPCMVEEWGLSQWKESILKRWNEINLYTMSRGINRFKGLAKALREIDGVYCTIKDIDVLERWVEESDELSNQALGKAWDKEKSIILKKALAWSERVNQKIDALSFEEKKPFPGVKEALAFAHERADVAIVSSANLQAVEEEWQQYDLLEDVDILLAQNMGSKARCIGTLLEKGYQPGNVMMVGDALGDYEAAEKNGVFFYPILVGEEKESWKELKEKALKKLEEGTFGGEYQKKKLEEFRNHLKQDEPMPGVGKEKKEW